MSEDCKAGGVWHAAMASRAYPAEGGRRPGWADEGWHIHRVTAQGDRAEGCFIVRVAECTWSTPGGLTEGCRSPHTCLPSLRLGLPQVPPCCSNPCCSLMHILSHTLQPLCSEMLGAGTRASQPHPPRVPGLCPQDVGSGYAWSMFMHGQHDAGMMCVHGQHTPCVRVQTACSHEQRELV